jgi:hypothetical protein
VAKARCSRCGETKDAALFATLVSQAGKQGGNTRWRECLACRENPRCTTCGKGPPEVDFYVRATGGRTLECCGCHAATSSRWYRRQKLANPRKHLLDRVKYRAWDAGIEFSITLEDVAIPTHCPITGRELLAVGQDGTHDDAPSLDRVDTRKGYVPGNVAVVSRRGNFLKGGATLEEHERIVGWMREKLGLGRKG